MDKYRDVIAHFDLLNDTQKQGLVQSLATQLKDSIRNGYYVGYENVENNEVSLDPTWEDDYNYDVVDMGPGGFWLACNLGAKSPQEEGLYFSYANTKGYSRDDFLVKNNPAYLGEKDYTKYNSRDNLVLLEPSDMPGFKNITYKNNKYRAEVPTLEDYLKLLSCCTYSSDIDWVTLTNPDTKNTLFFRGGCFEERSFLPSTKLLCSDLSTKNNTCSIIFNLSNRVEEDSPRYNGFQVRLILREFIPFS